MDDKKQITSLLKTHRDLDEETLEEMWEQALFIFDSNVLLDLYRLPQDAKNELLSILKNPEIKRRIWIGFQGLLEFLNNRHDIIGDQKNKFETVRTKLRDAISGYNDVVNKLTNELAQLKLRKKHSLIDPERFLTPEKIKSGVGFIHEFLENLNELEEQQNDVHDKDDTKEHILELFDGKVGQGLSKEEIRKIYEQGEERYKNDIPPGYMDKKKNHFYTVLDIDYKCKFGDLLFWHEVMQKAKEEKLPYIILITGDLKEDWWLEKRGKKLGPRKELLNEIYTAAPELKAFHMYDTSNFLRRVGERLTVTVSESTISETENLLVRGRNYFAGEEFVDVLEVFKLTISRYEHITCTISNSFEQLPLARIPLYTLYNVFFEILDNVRNHANTHHIITSVNLTETHYIIRFVNTYSENKLQSIIKLSSATNEVRSERGVGLMMIKEVLAAEGIDTKITWDDAVFAVELFIPISKFE